MEPERRGRWRDGVWLVFWLVASSACCVTSAKHLGATCDEPPYMRIGMERWRTGSYRLFMNVGTMPLATELQTLPLYLAERWRGNAYEVDADLPKILPWARATNLIFWWVLLVHGMLIGRRLAGPWGGRVAVAVLACEPNLLAHAALATTDIAVTALTLTLLYHFDRGRERGWFVRVGVPALGFATLVLAKASAVMLGPVCLTIVGLAWVAKRTGPNPSFATGELGAGLPVAPTERSHPQLPRGPALRSLARDVIQILVLGFALAAGYIGTERHPSESLPPHIELMSDTPYRHALDRYRHFNVFPNATEGVLFQVLQNARGTAAYAFGEVHPKGLWYYFPLALTMKLPVALLVLPLVIALLRPRALANWAVLVVVALLLISATYRVQNGVRLVLPLIALWSVGLSVATVRAVLETTGARCRVLAAALLAGIAWTALSSATAKPDRLCYFNEFWRGRPGYELLNDSNYDWGQGLKGLAQWHRDNGAPPLLVWTHGNDPGYRTMSVRQFQLDGQQLRTPEEHRAALRGHYFAVSSLLVYGYWDTPTVRFLRSCRPVAEASTYLIYDFTGP